MNVIQYKLSLDSFISNHCKYHFLFVFSYNKTKQVSSLWRVEIKSK